MARRSFLRKLGRVKGILEAAPSERWLDGQTCKLATRYPSLYGLPKIASGLVVFPVALG